MLNKVVAPARELEAVLKAADECVSAQEALVAAQRVSEPIYAGQDTADLAGCRLVVAVNRWRSSRALARQ
jgi:hypothetical protein